MSSAVQQQDAAAPQQQQSVPSVNAVTNSVSVPATPIKTEIKSEVVETPVDSIPRSLCSIYPTEPNGSHDASMKQTPTRSETPEDVMLEDCLQALSTLKQGNTPRMTPTEPLGGASIVPPVMLNGKKPRKKRQPRNAAMAADHPHTPSPAGRRRSVTYDDISSSTTASGLKPGRKSANGLLLSFSYFLLPRLGFA